MTEHPGRHRPTPSPPPRQPARRTKIGPWLRRRNIARFELGCVAAFHLLVAVTILAAPREQVVTPGTSAIFGTIPVLVWAVWFTATGLAAAAATIHVTATRLALTWIGVFPLGGAWIYGFSVAVTAGRGNAVFALVWPFLLAWWALLAWRLFVGGSENRWGGG